MLALTGGPGPSWRRSLHAAEVNSARGGGLGLRFCVCERGWSWISSTWACTITCAQAPEWGDGRKNSTIKAPGPARIRAAGTHKGSAGAASGGRPGSHRHLLLFRPAVLMGPFNALVRVGLLLIQMPPTPPWLSRSGAAAAPLISTQPPLHTGKPSRNGPALIHLLHKHTDLAEPHDLGPAAAATLVSIDFLQPFGPRGTAFICQRTVMVGVLGTAPACLSLRLHTVV